MEEQQNVNSVNMETPAKKGSKKTAVIAAVISGVIVIAAVIVCLIVVLGNSGPKLMEKGKEAFEKKTSEDDDLAIDYFERAAEKGEKKANYYLGQLYERKEKPEKAAKYYEKAAEEGDFEAAYKIGMMYFNGNGVE
jgi:tetratricopeptide (TPR) repeat protein